MSLVPSCFSSPICYLLPGLAIIVTVFGGHSLTKRRERQAQREANRQKWLDDLNQLVEEHENMAIKHFFGRKDADEVRESAAVIVNSLKRTAEKIRSISFASMHAKDDLMEKHLRFRDAVTGHPDFQNQDTTFPIDDERLRERISEIAMAIKAKARELCWNKEVG